MSESEGKLWKDYNALPIQKEIFNDVEAGHTNTPEASQAMTEFARRIILAALAASKP